MDIPKIVKDVPPNYGAIKVRFELGGREMVFTYGDTLYIPTGFIPSPDLLTHEMVHIQQQGNDPAGWWERYLKDDDFRTSQETEAYKEQYKYFCKKVTNRDERAKLLMVLAQDFSSSVYGKIVSYPQALALIRD